MTDAEWAALRGFAQGSSPALGPAGLIVDSPWIPGYCGVDTIDYYGDREIWLRCQDRVRGDFPGLLLLPGDWVEFGMAAEPSSFGCPVRFFHEQTVGIGHLITSADDLPELDGLPIPDPQRDGLMPLALSRIRSLRGALAERGRRMRHEAP